MLRVAKQPDLTTEEQGKFAALLKKWEKVFSTNEEDFGRLTLLASDSYRERIFSKRVVPALASTAVQRDESPVVR